MALVDNRREIALLDQVFLEYSSLFSDTFGVTDKELLLQCPTPVAISVRKLTTLLDKAGYGRLFGEEKAKELRRCHYKFVQCGFCQEYICVSDTAVSGTACIFGKPDRRTGWGCCKSANLCKLADSPWFFYEKPIRSKMGEGSRPPPNPSPPSSSEIPFRLCIFITTCNNPNQAIATIPGISDTLGAIIVLEIGDINRLEMPNRRVALAVSDVKVTQSVEFNRAKQYIAKRGLPYLRLAIWLAAQRAAFCGSILSNYH